MYYTYIMSNLHHTVLYIGVTSNLSERIELHQSSRIKGFTKKYNCHKLVLVELFDDIMSAIYREKQLKNWNRVWKEELISQSNPDWHDLSEMI